MWARKASLGGGKVAGRTESPSIQGPFLGCRTFSGPAGETGIHDHILGWAQLAWVQGTETTSAGNPGASGSSGRFTYMRAQGYHPWPLVLGLER